MNKRTNQEIVERLRTMTDPFSGQTITDLLEFLPWEEAREFLKPDIGMQEWADDGLPNEYTEEYILRQMGEYLQFAFEKATDERGLSAMRSMCHYKNWFWLLGDQAPTWAGDQLLDYDDYGKANLVKITDWINEHPRSNLKL